MLAAQE
jgi:hypothetical protein